MRNRVAWVVLAGLVGGSSLQCGIVEDGDTSPSDAEGDGVDGGRDTEFDSPTADSEIPDAGSDEDMSLGPICDPGALAAALAEAHNGDEVVIGPGCDITGAFDVPAGVILRGEVEAAVPTLRSPEGVNKPVLTLHVGTGTTSISNLRIVSSSNYGIVARGTGVGAIDLKDLTVESTRGVAIGAEGLAAATLARLSLRGPHTAAELRRSNPAMADPDATATHGLVIVRGGDVNLEGVDIQGFAVIGGVMIDDDITWSAGVIADNGLAGLLAHGGTATLTDLAIRGLRSPSAFPLDTSFDETRSWTGPPTFGAVFVGSTTVATSGVVVERGLHFGLAHADGGTVTHDGLTVRQCGDTGVWAQDVLSFTLRGTADLPARLEANHFAGIMLYEPDTTTIADVQVVGTARGCHRCGTLDEVESGDGIQVVWPKTSLDLHSVSLENNARIGLLLDLGGTAMPTMSVVDLSVTGAPTTFGAQAQNGAATDGWDVGIERIGALGENDGTYRGPPLPVGSRLPPKAFPSMSLLLRDGLVGLIDPTPPH
jgi:hypothetical protein